MCLYLVPGPVGSVSSIMDTTWAVISWSVPSYIPSDYPIITYEIGYHILQYVNCLMLNYYDFNTEILQLRNSTNTLIVITGLNVESCYILGVRAYTDNGYGEWTVIANETLKLPLQLSSNHATSDSVIALSVLVGILCGLLTVSVVVHIYCFIRKKSPCSFNKQTKINDDDIAMQVCEPYEIHKTKQSEEKEGVHDECQTSPDDIYL
ncbi:PREDICTED: uncharacterized protein LOC109586644 [Amphimedon queenslandica]|uniref:Fibronectin type-III domain-containing protein n=1 Tax=Amphimedon queenslandica TaxID=400682 RepID=A0AAN0JN12_AMPQE|nr:PREDICTED: uncharacterized protein LOC109586644 [Amphimedon queenslandica]|eukprot:XP_019858398.1 PREDICTED: uncharacterized protein LOC109586644 [Amphimedon queenslandica]